MARGRLRNKGSAFTQTGERDSLSHVEPNSEIALFPMKSSASESGRG